MDGDRSGLDFGNARYVAVTGLKYHDRNGNGRRDDGEPGLAGWTFTITFGDGTVRTVTTASNGAWRLMDSIPEGTTIRVVETNQTGWIQTEPANGAAWSGSVVADTSVRFGNTRVFPVGGEKYNDLDGDGRRDTGEPGISGIRFRMTWTDTTGKSRSTEATSGSDGAFAFADSVSEGTSVTVQELLDPSSGWLQTEPAGGAAWRGTATAALRARFGNTRAARLAGRKYYDSDRNGAISPGDALASGLGGFTIVVNVWFNNVKTATETVTTNVDGTWSTSGSYRSGSRFTVDERVPAGWAKVWPTRAWSGNIGSANWPVQSDGTVRGLDFLNIRLGGGGGIPPTYWCTESGLWALSFGGNGVEGTLAFLRRLNLVGFAGVAFDPDMLECLCCWFHMASQANMSYALAVEYASARLAVVLAPVRNIAGAIVGGLDPESLVWAPGTESGGASGIARLETLLDEVDRFLGAHPLTLNGHPQRARANQLRIILNRINRNSGFVLPSP